MASTFDPICEEFEEELSAIKAVINAFADPGKGNPRTRVAAANSATLLLAATFEEFVREMARAYARVVVCSFAHPAALPKKLSTIAWKRTMESLSQLKLDVDEGALNDAIARFNVVYEFCRGDLTQDIYRDLIHNDNNMRPGELNGLFKISGLRDTCRLVCDKTYLVEVLGEPDQDVAHGMLLRRLEEFFERRNQTAHSINMMRSSAPDIILKDVDLLAAFGRSLTETLEQNVPH